MSWSSRKKNDCIFCNTFFAHRKYFSEKVVADHCKATDKNKPTFKQINETFKTTSISHRSDTCKWYDDLVVSGFVFNILKSETVE